MIIILIITRYLHITEAFIILVYILEIMLIYHIIIQLRYYVNISHNYATLLCIIYISNYIDISHVYKTIYIYVTCKIHWLNHSKCK